MSLFITKAQLSDNFIFFGQIKSRVNNCNAIDNCPLYFQIAPDSDAIHIVQPIEIEAHQTKLIILAHFYKYFYFYDSLFDLYKNRNMFQENIKIQIDFKNNTDKNFFIIKLDIYVDKLYLNQHYTTGLTHLPDILLKIIYRNSTKISRFMVNYGKKQDTIKINTSLTTDDENLHAQYYRNLFPYQKNNIIQMKKLETKIKHTHGFYDTFMLGNNVESIFKINAMNDYIFCDKNGLICNREENTTPSKLYYKGGVLADEIGLGKTCSMIGLIMESYKDTASLILCPTRLCKQWEDEIKLTGNLTCKIVSTIIQFKRLDKIKHQLGKEINVIIVSYAFLSNLNYKQYIEENENGFRLNTYTWERVILDEGHEYLHNNVCYCRKSIRIPITEIYNLKSNYRWLCSGTPFANNYSFWNIINYLTNQVLQPPHNICKLYYHLLEQMCNDLFIKSTKESICDQITIPNYTIDTRFLDQTPIEKMIYASALGDRTKMIELCNHILVSEQHLNILGNKPLSFNEIHEKMTAYYQKKVEKFTKRIAKIKSNKSSTIGPTEIEEKIKTAEYELSVNQSKYNIFNALDEKVNEVDTCPVCLNDFSSISRSITPCGHIICVECISTIFGNSHTKPCPMCRFTFNKTELQIFESEQMKSEGINGEDKWGTKMSALIKYITQILNENNNNRFIVFSQWDSMLKLVGNVLQKASIQHLFLNGSIHVLNGRIKRFKLDTRIRVVLLSSEKAASGLNLTEASHIVLLDTLNTDKATSKIIEEQAIGRAVRIGQQKIVHVQRFIMRDTIEHEYYIRNITI